MACPYALAPGPRKDGDIRAEHQRGGQSQRGTGKGPMVLQGRTGCRKGRLHRVHHDVGIVGRPDPAIPDAPEGARNRRRAGSHSNGHALALLSERPLSDRPRRYAADNRQMGLSIFERWSRVLPICREHGERQIPIYD